MKRRTRPDPVTPALREAVLRRDRGCVARKLKAPGSCTTRFGWPAGLDTLELDHVREQPMMGKRAPSDMGHLVSLCWFHHQGSGWATANRPLLREYLASVNEKREAA